MDPIRIALVGAGETGLIPTGSSVLLAVSGGADSMALLYGAVEAAKDTGWRLSVGHVHHGWRPKEGERDLAFVAEHAKRLGLPFFSRHADARRAAKELGLSPEAGARHVRYRALAEMAAEAGAGIVATAHQHEDAVESHVLARERQGGIAALAGPQESRADGVVRPLLSVSRQEILAFLAERGVAFRRDASNGDLRLARNRVRRTLARLKESPGGEDTLRAMALEIARLGVERRLLESEYETRILPAAKIGRGWRRDRRGAARGLLRRTAAPRPLPPGRPLRPPRQAANDRARARAAPRPARRRRRLPLRGGPAHPLRAARSEILGWGAAGVRFAGSDLDEEEEPGGRSVKLVRRFESRQIAERVEAVAGAIDRDLRERPLIVVSLLKGSAFFMADLTRKLRGPFSCEFMHVRRAEGAREVLQIDFASGFTVRDKHVLLLKDVVHTGIIETYLMDHLRGDGAASLHLGAIVDKPIDRTTSVTVDFSLFSAEDSGLFAGYGMEHEGLHAHLPDIYEVVPEQ